MSTQTTKVIVINGGPAVGKDTFVDLCKKEIGWVFNYSTVDFVKSLASTCGWDGTKTPENRKFLSDLKTLLDNWNDVTFKNTKNAVLLFTKQVKDFAPDEPSVIFIHCREPDKILRLVNEFGAKTLLITRQESNLAEVSNESDKNVAFYDYDFVIENNGTIEELAEKAQKFIREVVIGE